MASSMGGGVKSRIFAFGAVCLYSSKISSRFCLNSLKGTCCHAESPVKSDASFAPSQSVMKAGAPNVSHSFFRRGSACSLNHLRYHKKYKRYNNLKKKLKHSNPSTINTWCCIRTIHGSRHRRSAHIHFAKGSPNLRDLGHQSIA